MRIIFTSALTNNYLLTGNYPTEDKTAIIRPIIRQNQLALS
ncbi:MAG: hypothetical protein WC523_02810 [Patescibacteria group bacterium]